MLKNSNQNLIIILIVGSLPCKDLKFFVSLLNKKKQNISNDCSSFVKLT